MRKIKRFNAQNLGFLSGIFILKPFFKKGFIRIAYPKGDVKRVYLRFRSNLLYQKFLKKRRIVARFARGIPKNQWAARSAAETASQKSESQILERVKGIEPSS